MLAPVNTELQTRFARSCTDAAFGYARAASAAYAAMADQTLDFWATAAKRPTSSTPASSYYVSAPRRMAAPSIPMTPFDFFQMSNPWSDASRAASPCRIDEKQLSESELQKNGGSSLFAGEPEVRHHDKQCASDTGQYAPGRKNEPQRVAIEQRRARASRRLKHHT